MRDWMEHANCRDVDPRVFDNRVDLANQPFGDDNDRHTGHDWDRARAICGGCHVRAECFEQVMAIGPAEPIEFFAAGLNPRQLRALHRRRTGRKKSA